MKTSADILKSLETITMTEFRRKFHKFAKRAEEGEVFVVTKYGKPFIVLIGHKKYSALQTLADSI